MMMNSSMLTTTAMPMGIVSGSDSMDHSMHGHHHGMGDMGSMGNDSGTSHHNMMMHVSFKNSIIIYLSKVKCGEDE